MKKMGGLTELKRIFMSGLLTKMWKLEVRNTRYVNSIVQRSNTS